MSDSVTLTYQQATVLRQTGRVEFEVEGAVCWYHSQGDTLDDGDDPCICAPPAKWAALDVECPTCEGDGFKPVEQRLPGNHNYEQWKCADCHGTGRTAVRAVAECSSGKCDSYHLVASVSVRVEPDGDQFRVILTSVGGAK